MKACWGSINVRLKGIEDCRSERHRSICNIYEATENTRSKFVGEATYKNLQAMKYFQNMSSKPTIEFPSKLFLSLKPIFQPQYPKPVRYQCLLSYKCKSPYFLGFFFLSFTCWDESWALRNWYKWEGSSQVCENQSSTIVTISTIFWNHPNMILTVVFWNWSVYVKPFPQVNTKHQLSQLLSLSCVLTKTLGEPDLQEAFTFPPLFLKTCRN